MVPRLCEGGVEVSRGYLGLGLLSEIPLLVGSPKDL